MQILLLAYNDSVSLSGSFTSIIDLYFSLRKFATTSVDMRIMFDIKTLDMFKYFKVQNFFGDIHKYGHNNLHYNNRHTVKHLPIIKVRTGR